MAAVVGVVKYVAEVSVAKDVDPQSRELVLNVLTIRPVSISNMAVAP